MFDNKTLFGIFSIICLTQVYFGAAKMYGPHTPYKITSIGANGNFDDKVSVRFTLQDKEAKEAAALLNREEHTAENAIHGAYKIQEKENEPNKLLYYFFAEVPSTPAPFYVMRTWTDPNVYHVSIEA